MFLWFFVVFIVTVVCCIVAIIIILDYIYIINNNFRCITCQFIVNNHNCLKRTCKISLRCTQHNVIVVRYPVRALYIAVFRTCARARNTLCFDSFHRLPFENYCSFDIFVITFSSQFFTRNLAYQFGARILSHPIHSILRLWNWKVLTRSSISCSKK